MGLASLLLAAASTAAAPTPGVPPGNMDFDLPLKELNSTLNSPFLRDMTTVAMALPYGPTRMSCRAREWQPLRGWAPLREPSGKIAWSAGPEVSVRWAGIYGTCQIVAPVPRAEMPLFEREALECECNGWLPKGISEFPLP